MKTNQEITDAINKIVESVERGYEMGCEISEEFTPAPDYRTPILKWFKENNVDIDTYQRSLTQEESWELHCLLF